MKATMRTEVKVERGLVHVDGGLRGIVMHMEHGIARTTGLRSRLLRRLKTKGLRELLDSVLQGRGAPTCTKTGNQSKELTALQSGNAWRGAI